MAIRKSAESVPKDPSHWTGISYLPEADQSLLDWRFNPRTGLACPAYRRSAKTSRIVPTEI